MSERVIAIKREQYRNKILIKKATSMYVLVARAIETYSIDKKSNIGRVIARK